MANKLECILYYIQVTNPLPTTWGLALLGQDVGTSAVARYQLRFRQDVINLALVHIFNF